MDLLRWRERLKRHEHLDINLAVLGLLSSAEGILFFLTYLTDVTPLMSTDIDNGHILCYNGKISTKQIIRYSNLFA